MKQYQSFIFGAYDFDESTGRIRLTYSLDSEIHFTETLVLPGEFPIKILDREALNRALFMLHLIGGMSYYKTCLPKTIEVRSGQLSTEQAEFWNTVYTQGLGEFFYKNDIDFRGLINFPAEPGNSETRKLATDNRSPHALVPIGGGKDSVVTIELLKKGNFKQTLLRIGRHPFIDTMVMTAGLPGLMVERKLPDALFELNAQGALNGHVPITAYMSILSVVLAEIYGYSHVVFSNERSANEGNIEMHGMQINHQWSKSLEFETMLREYLQTYVTKNVEYVNLLRPLSELHIVQLFTQYPKYFEHFTSCNKNWKILKENRWPASRSAAPEKDASAHLRQGYGGQPPLRGGWCGKCPKCAFAFALFASFLDKATMLKIFGKNLFEDETLLPLYRELLGLEGIKPFECVGTPEETYAALMLADEKEEWAGTPVMKMLEEEANEKFKNADIVVENCLKPSSEHHLSDQFKQLLPQ